MIREPEPEQRSPIGVGMWRRPAAVECSSATPCCNATVTATLSELNVVGQMTATCPECGLVYQLRFQLDDPIRNQEALWLR